MTTNLRFGSFELRPSSRQLLADGQEVELGARAFDVLQALIQRRERVVTKQELLDLAWPGVVVEENNLQVQISTLRKILGQHAIVTVQGRGYQFTLEVTTDAGPRSETSISAGVTATADVGLLSIMVLPFQNLTGEPTQAYVADGLTASLTCDLSRIRDAFVVDAATAFTYKDKPMTAQEIGKELGVRFVLHGSVQRSGTEIRINAQLADTTSNAQLWSERFDGDQSDLFALQDRVTTLVGNSIGRQMVIRAARESETRKSSPKVSELMLRARALKLNPVSLKTLRQSVELYRQALALESNNASAMVGLAGSLATEASNFGSQMDDDIKENKYAEARDLALRAKELDPDNPGVYYALGSYAASHGDQAAYLRAREMQLSLEPRDPTACNNLAVAFFHSGDPKRSIELTTQAINLDPRHPNELTLANLGRAYFMLGDNDAAIRWLQKSLEVNSAFPYTHAYLAMAYALQGEDAQARAEAAELRRLGPNIKLSAFLDPSSTATYREWYESKLVPAWRKAGLPE